MSTWEERMSAKAKVRIAAQQTVEEAERTARRAAECAEWEARNAAQRRELEEQGPPCSVCYVLWQSPHDGAWAWSHIFIETDDALCWHKCHGEGDNRYYPVIALA